MPNFQSVRIIAALCFAISVSQSVVASPHPIMFDHNGEIISSQERTVCGQNDMVPMVSQSSDFIKMGGPIGIYSVEMGGGVGKCTGTLISNDLFLTAKHCEGDCKGISVTFGYLQDGRAKETFNCKEIVEKGDAAYNNDYMIVRLEGSPGVGWGFYEPSARELSAGQELLMMHHPSGSPMKVSSKNCQLMGLKDGFVEHRCDTEPGSSGSAIFLPDFKNPEKTRIIGVHTLGGCNEQETQYNSGPAMANLVKISPILKSLAKD